jgi:hypothetical protein
VRWSAGRLSPAAIAIRWPCCDRHDRRCRKRGDRLRSALGSQRAPQRWRRQGTSGGRGSRGVRFRPDRELHGSCLAEGRG